MRLGLAAAGISTDFSGEGIDDEPDMHLQDPHAQTVRAIARRAAAELWRTNEPEGRQAGEDNKQAVTPDAVEGENTA